jgi:hypothetical protein
MPLGIGGIFLDNGGGEAQGHSILAVGVRIVKDFVGFVLERTTDVRISEWI